MVKTDKKGEKFKREKWKEGERIRHLNKEFKMINVVVFGKHTKNVHDSKIFGRVPPLNSS